MNRQARAARRARIIAIAIIAVTGIAVLATGAARMLKPRPDHVDPDRERYPITGIDISAHNGFIDFGRVAADSISFVYIKASEGTTFRDANFEDNFDRDTSRRPEGRRLPFFRFDSEGWRQGANLLRALGHRTPDMPLAIDVEEWRNHSGGVTGEIILQLHAMVDYLRAAGHHVIIYTNKGGHRRFIRGHFDDTGLWVCSFTDPPISRADWLLWQHSHSGRVDGVAGPVDLNTFCGDSAAWRTALSRWAGQ